jgi:cellulose synthase (UDP-forming)
MGKKMMYKTHPKPGRARMLFVRVLILILVITAPLYLINIWNPSSWGDRSLAIPMVIADTYSVLLTLFYLPIFWMKKHPIHKRGKVIGEVLILLPTYNEPLDLLEENIIACKEAAKLSPNPTRIAVLDDGDRNELRLISERHGVLYNAREERIDYKMGNLNEGIKKFSNNNTAYYLVFDSDFIPQVNILKELLPYMSDKNVGLVETPQTYRNQDIARHYEAAPFWYGVMQRGKYGLDAFLCCGTPTLWKREALEKAGMFSGTSTEDFATGVNIQNQGYKIVYVDKYVADGLGSEDLLDIFSKMRRYTRTAFETILIDTKPWNMKNLSNSSKFFHTGHLFSFFSWISLPTYLLIPIFSFWFDLRPYAFTNNFLIIWMAFFIPGLLMYSAISFRYNRYKTQGIMIIHTLTSFLGIFDYFMKARNWNVSSKEKKNNSFKSILLVYPWLIIFIANVVLITVYALNWEVYVRNETATAAMFWALINSILMLPTLYALERDLRQDFKNLDVQVMSKIKGMGRIGYYMSLPMILLIMLGATTPKYYDVYSNLARIYDTPTLEILEEEGVLVGVFDPELKVNPIENDFDRNFDLFLRFQSWGGEYKDFDVDLYNTINENGYIYVLTWEPWNPWNKDENFTLEEIASGAHDQYIREWANSIASTNDSGEKLLIRWGHEMNYGSYPWSNQSPESYTNAFVHIRDIFHEENSKALFVFSPITTQPWGEYYPGAENVDVIGLTALNFSKDSARADIALLQESYDEALLTGKPIIIAETASANKVENKVYWINTLRKSLQDDMPKISGMIWFNDESDPRTQGTNWSFGDKGSVSNDAIKDMYQDEYFNILGKEYYQWKL